VKFKWLMNADTKMKMLRFLNLGVLFGKMEFGRMELGNMEFGKMDFGKVELGKMV